jgi:uncharacterized protein (DUF1697 family)
MTKYIAFLRGINVGNIRIKMTDLKAAFEQMKCREVATFLQTGNVVFHSEKTLAELKPILEKGLTDTFNYKAYVLLYAFDSLSEMIAKYPFETVETHHAYVVFVENQPAFDELKTLAEGLGDESKVIAFGQQVIYWKVVIGETLHTPFAKIIAKAKYKSSTTVRNINTLEKMIA